VRPFSICNHIAVSVETTYSAWNAQLTGMRVPSVVRFAAIHITAASRMRHPVGGDAAARVQ